MAELLNADALAREIEDTPDPDAEAVAVWAASVRAMRDAMDTAMAAIRDTEFGKAHSVLFEARYPKAPSRG